jgi:hypothetical protein
MRGRFPVFLMSMMALALVLGLVVTLAPDAGAQDSVTAPAGLSKWMRYDAPPTQSLEAVTSANFVSQRKTCCITIVSGTTPFGPLSATGVNPEPAAGFLYGGDSRWICWGDN